MKRKKIRSAQEVQDKIFREMTADRKIEVGSMLWRLAKDLVGDKINPVTFQRSTRPRIKNKTRRNISTASPVRDMSASL